MQGQEEIVKCVERNNAGSTKVLFITKNFVTLDITARRSVESKLEFATFIVGILR